MDRAKILDKIQKCLNLSKSPEPHEAAAALRQAQKLMDVHSVTDRELGLAEYTSEKVDCPIQASKSGKLPENLTTLTSLIQRAFGVRVTVHREVRVSDYSWCITYYGKSDRVALAAYTHPVIWRAMDGSWLKRIKTTHRHLKGERGARSSYHIGWLMGVERQVTALALTEEELKVLDDMINEQTEGRVSATNHLCDYNVDALRAGHRAAKDFALNRPIGG